MRDWQVAMAQAGLEDQGSRIKDSGIACGSQPLARYRCIYFNR